MDLNELNIHCDKVQKLNEAKELYAITKARALGSQKLTGMPHGTGVTDKAGALAAALADISAHITCLEQQVAETAPAVEEFVAGIPVLRTRLIFRYRFLNGMTWGEVAGMFDSATTETSVKNVVYTYLDHKTESDE